MASLSLQNIKKVYPNTEKKKKAKEAQKKMLEQSFANVGKSPIQMLIGGRK